MAFIIGFQQGCEHESDLKNAYVSFYAHISKIDNKLIHVSGIPENDINHRNDFTFTIDTSTKIYDSARNEIESSQLSVGDEVRVVYIGTILETAPAQIQKVVEIDCIT